MRSLFADPAEICSCGKVHTAELDAVISERGAINKIPEIIRGYGKSKPYLIADKNTWAAAGKRLATLLDAEGIDYSAHIFEEDELEPDERTVGGALMHYDDSCDIIIGVGTGVINDTAKIIARTASRKYIICATAPSMDGYASATSSMIRGGFKISLDSKCADTIVADLDILAEAPMKAIISGIGDMLAKYVSIAEWRIGALVTGEYYCEATADIIRDSLKRCVDAAPGLIVRDREAVRAVVDGLVGIGIAMAYVGLSRPASGIEHYFSHIWDMRGLSLGTPVETHGIQCALGTLEAVKLYEALKGMKPDRERALASVGAFDYEAWKETLRKLLGASAEPMIATEAKEQKYSPDAHKIRLERIIENWDGIIKILDEELPAYDELLSLCRMLGLPTDPAEIGVDRETAKLTFKATRDVRDKYILSRIAWDLGISDELAELI